MPKRVVTKVGDIFATGNGVLLQLVGIDSVQLNSDVVAVYQEKNIEDFSTINKRAISFYHHTTVSAGVKRGLWKKVGKGPIPNPAIFIFKQYFNKDDAEILDEHPNGLFKKVLKPKPYCTYWSANESKWHRISESRGKKLKAEDGAIAPPSAILHRIDSEMHDIKSRGDIK